MKGDLRGIAKAIRLSHATMRNVKQNLFFCLRLQRAPHPCRGRGPVPRLWPAAIADFRRRGDGAELGVGGNQRAATVAREAVILDWKGAARAMCILLTRALFDVCQVVLSAAPPKCSI